MVTRRVYKYKPGPWIFQGLCEAQKKAKGAEEFSEFPLSISSSSSSLKDFQRKKNNRKGFLKPNLESLNPILLRSHGFRLDRQRFHSFGPKKRQGFGQEEEGSAKLKQCKLDVRREQWLSSGAVVKKECKEEQNGGVQGRRERNSPREMGPREGENVGSIHHHHHHDSDLDSNSPSSFTSSVLGGHDSETFTGSSSSSSSGDCCSGNITEEDEDDGCLDDWEAVADALAADEKPKNQNPEPQREHEAIAKSVPASQIENSKPQCARAMPKAWRPDDAFRPQSLPNLAKQLSLPNSSGKRFGGGVAWGCNSVVSPPSSCPICYEDLDLTDTSFLPCLCGFRLCLFCHKRILEGDGRCPGCRKPYENEPVEAETSVHGGSLTFRLPRSCSMITRS